MFLASALISPAALMWIYGITAFFAMSLLADVRMGIWLVEKLKIQLRQSPKVYAGKRCV